jgi:peptide/nickel transport system substrate-binding protein
MIELEANPDYYRGKPRIERVVLKFGGSAPLPELLSGNVDVITYVNRADIPELVADPRFRIYDHLYGFGWLDVIFWNHRHHLFREPAVRRALTLAINRRELRQAVNLPADLPIFDVLFTKRQYRDGELPEPLPYDPAAAKRLLQEAGWRDEDGDGVRERAGKRFRFKTIVRADDELEHAAVYVQSQLRRVGIHMEVQVLDASVVWARVRAGDFQTTIHRLHNQASGDNGHLALFGEDSRIGWHNPRVAELLHAAELAIDPDEQDRIYRELMPIFQAELPITFLQPQVETFVAHRRLRGLSSPFWANPLQNMDYLWLEDER